MLAHRPQRWANIIPALGQRIVFAGNVNDQHKYDSMKIIIKAVLFYQSYLE